MNKDYKYWSDKFKNENEKISHESAIDFINKMRTLPTQKIILNALNKIIFENEKIDSKKIEWKSHLKKQAEVLNLEQINLLINDEWKLLNKEELISISIGLLTGARLSEIKKIYNEYQNSKNNIVEITSKNNKKRKIFLIPKLIKIIEENELDDKLFFEKSDRTINNKIKSGLDKYQFNFNFKTHSLRRSFATNIFNFFPEKIVLLKNILGHENLNTTIEYIGVNNDEYLKLIDLSFDNKNEYINDINYKNEYLKLIEINKKLLEKNFQQAKIIEGNDLTINQLLNHIADKNKKKLEELKNARKN